MVVGEVSAVEAVPYVKERHYTGSASPGTHRFGLYDNSGRLRGVSIYNLGTRAMQDGPFGPDFRALVRHHHRLAVDETMPKGTASEFLGACLRELARDGVVAVLTYADSCQGHVGTVYQATNAIYTGRVGVGNLKFRTPEGTIVPTQSLSGSWPERRAQARELGWTEERCRGKHRYVNLLGTPSQKRRYRALLRWPELPYPKLPTCTPESPAG